MDTTVIKIFPTRILEALIMVLSAKLKDMDVEMVIRKTVDYVLEFAGLIFSRRDGDARGIDLCSPIMKEAILRSLKDEEERGATQK